MTQNVWMSNVNIDMNGRSISGDVDLLQVTELQVTDADWSFNRDMNPINYALELAEYIQLRFRYSNVMLDEYAISTYSDLLTWAQKRAGEAYPNRQVCKITSVKFYPKGGYNILVQFYLNN